MEKLIEAVVKFIKDNFPEDMIEKVLIGLLSYKTGKLTYFVEQAKKASEMREKARETENKIDNDKEYEKEVEDYFNKDNPNE